MKEIITYQAFDGKIFENRTECENYENKKNKEVRAAVKTLNLYCKQFADCLGCSLLKSDHNCILSKYIPQDWNKVMDLDS